jgi:hypothetical protein
MLQLSSSCAGELSLMPGRRMLLYAFKENSLDFEPTPDIPLIVVMLVFLKPAGTDFDYDKSYLRELLY